MTRAVELHHRGDDAAAFQLLWSRPDAGDAEAVIWRVDPLAQLRKLDEAGDVEGFTELLFAEGSLSALSTGVIGSVLRKSVPPEHPWESLLTRIRAVLLDVAFNETDPAHPLFLDPSLACVLAQQCWLNGFVFSRSSVEELRAHRLGERLMAFGSSEDHEDIARLAGGTQPADGTQLADLGRLADVARLSVLACYDGLLEWRLEAEAIEMAKIHALEPFVDLLMLQVAEPIAEIEIADGLETVGVISGGVSRAARKHDERTPFPRWVSIDLQTPAPVAEKMSEWIPGVDFSDQVDLRAPRILVAGCGTGRSLARMASCFANATVTGVDLSRRSLAYASRMMTEHGFGNTELYHADILSLADWDRRFDIIECGGVLHHMEDPMAGWRVLKGLLEPGGLMRISLYSDLALGPVVEARDFIARKRLGSTSGDIRTLRQRVFDGELPWRDILKWKEFWSLGECRELLFHAQEHRFTVPQITECVSELGLEFVGFEEAHPATFTGMYEFWLKKPGAEAERSA